jgi:hypothetical protein
MDAQELEALLRRYGQTRPLEALFTPEQRARL